MGFLEDLKKKQEYRMWVCENHCDKYMPKNKTCEVCGCYMPVKTAVPYVQCPLKKWD